MKSPPDIRSSLRETLADARKRLLNEDDSNTKQRHQRDPVTMKHKPKTMNEMNLEGLSSEINCGTKAKKKIATFGFNTLVKNPCFKIMMKSDSLKCFGITNEDDRLLNILNPI